jgi:hypothetical protein
VYYAAKQAKQLFSLELGGIGTVPFKSPRAGLLEIGPGLFPDLQGHKVQNILLDVYRASTLFHEARHSDGHGKTLGFFHATCPSWHDYAGKPACDASTNGPYTIGAMVMKNLAAQCTSQCTELTKRALQSLYLDVAGRALSVRDLPHNSPESPAGGAWDDIPEGTP